MTPMTPTQTEFFKALQAPIPHEDLRTRSQAGRTFTYITNRTLFNRLDEVAGPTNWYPEYVITPKGFTCKLWINVPDDDPELSGRRWMYKEDGGGFAGMAETDNDAKSAYSDAAKRAGMCWGVARELYKDGMPDYIGDEPQPERPTQQAPPQRQQQPQQNQQQQQRQAPPQRQAGPPQRQAPPQRGGGNSNGGGGGGNYDNFKLPPTGKAVFAWAKNLEGVFGTGIIKEMQAAATEFGYGTTFNEWDSDQLMYVGWAMIDVVKTWQSYKGEFDHLVDPRQDPQ